MLVNNSAEKHDPKLGKYRTPYSDPHKRAAQPKRRRQTTNIPPTPWSQKSYKKIGGAFVEESIYKDIMMFELRLRLVDCAKQQKRTKIKPAKSKSKKRKAPKKRATPRKRKAVNPFMETSDDESIPFSGFVSHSENESMAESSVAESSCSVRTLRSTRRSNIIRNGLLSKRSEAYQSDTDGETVQPIPDKQPNRRTKKRANHDDNKLRQNSQVIVNTLDECYASSEPNTWCDISEAPSIQQQNTISMDIVPCGSANKPAHSNKKQNSTAEHPTDNSSIEMDHSETGTTQSANPTESCPESDLSARTAKCHNTPHVMLRRLTQTQTINHCVDNVSEPTEYSAPINQDAQTVPATEQLVDTVIETSKPIKKRKVTTKSHISAKRRNTLMTTDQPATETELSTVATQPPRIRVRNMSELVQHKISAVPIRNLMPYKEQSKLVCKVMLEPLSKNLDRFNEQAVVNNSSETTTPLLDESFIEPEDDQSVCFSPHLTNRAIQEMDYSANSIVNYVSTEPGTSAATCMIPYDEDDAEIAEINRNHDSDSDRFAENQYSSDSVTSDMYTNPRSPLQSPISPFAFDNAVDTLVAAEVYSSPIESPQGLRDIANVPTQESAAINVLEDLPHPTSWFSMISSITDTSLPNNSGDRHIQEPVNGQGQSSNTTIQQLPQDPITEATTQSASIQLETGDNSTETIDDIVSPEYEEHIIPDPKSPVFAEKGARRRRNTSSKPKRIPRNLANIETTSAQLTPLQPKAIAVVSDQRVSSSQEDLLAFANKSTGRLDLNDLTISSTIYTLGDTLPPYHKKRLGIEKRRYTTFDTRNRYTEPGKPNRKLIVLITF